MDSRNAAMKRGNSKRRARRNESVKVVYISTPMKVTTSASKFKSLVQQLTGRHSDIYRIMETNGTTEFETFPDDNHLDDGRLSLTDSGRESSAATTTTSESLTELLDDHAAFSTEVDEMFPIDLFLDVNYSDLEADVLCSSYAL
nr:sigma factor binding protein 1, chloroplastic-like [Ipomoea batatas]